MKKKLNREPAMFKRDTSIYIYFKWRIERNKKQKKKYGQSLTNFLNKLIRSYIDIRMDPFNSYFSLSTFAYSDDLKSEGENTSSMRYDL